MVTTSNGGKFCMQYFIAFLEGIITFISPCLLPMLPIYVSYFAGGTERSKGKIFITALGFVTGFTLVFVSLGAFAGFLGGLLAKYKTLLGIVSGAVVILFGLHFLGVVRLGIFKGRSRDVNTENMGFFSAMIFGLVFSVSWTPCVGAFLGSALMLASLEGHVAEGVVMLLLYSIGLGIPFMISAVLIDSLKSTFDFIKRHYKAINVISGILLIIVGIMMATGTLGWLLSIML